MIGNRHNPAQLFDHGIFDIVRKVLDGIDGSDDVIGKFTYIPCFLHFQGEHGDIVTRITFLLFEKTDAIGSIFQWVADAIFNIGRGGTGIDDCDQHFTGLELRKRLFIVTSTLLGLSCGKDSLFRLPRDAKPSAMIAIIRILLMVGCAAK